jgi:tetratricopeptide (TPR) repeat protein
VNRPLVGKQPTFHRSKSRDNSYRILLWLFLIVGALWLLRSVESGEIKPLLVATPTPTRMANSYIKEAEAYFAAGKLDDPNSENDAIDTYKLALEEDPEDAKTWADLARIQTYSSNMLSTKEQILKRLEEAMSSADQAVKLADDNAEVHAVRAFVLDWYASYAPQKDKDELLYQAEQDAVRAIQIDPNDPLALSFYAEILLDQMKWTQAEQYARQAVERDPSLMDPHRVYGTVLESLGDYESAIQEYQEAVKITPNLTFLYIKIGVNYRYLAQGAHSEASARPIYDQALENFQKATGINDQLGILDPIPYIAIAKTYTQMGEFFIAARNAEKALALDPTEANTYGQLGIIYFKSKNYEYSLPALKCAVESCSAEENLVLKRMAEEYPQYGVQPVAVQGLPLDTQEVAYYYAEYGQVLAFLSLPSEDKNYCPQAYPVLSKVREVFGSDDVLMSIVNGSEAYCRTLEGEITR